MERHTTADLVHQTGINTSIDNPVKRTKRAGVPFIDPLVQMKWGLTLLGEEKAAQYLSWMRKRLHGHDG